MSIESSVSQIMTRDVISVSPDAPVSEAARLMWQNNVSGLPVVEQNKVIGMLTEYDLISRESEFDAPMYVPFLDAIFKVPGTGDKDQLRRILATSVRQLMTSPVMVLDPGATVQDAATAMYENRINALPVIEEDGTLVGIVTRTDIVRMMVRDESGEPISE